MRITLLTFALALSLAPPHAPASPAAESAQPAPGAPGRPAELSARLAAALAARGPDYEPRTRHRTADGSPRFVNRLILETSPYLLQHAHNPVDWHPWDGDAFTLARRLDRPVLLSIGYSTCHWCHVMERESFEDLEIARFINEHFVPIKVDREERPDVDSVYMTAVQLISGRGGWPMTLWLTPDATPFFGGTYYPARDGDRGVEVGFLTLLRRVSTAYSDSRGDLVESGRRLAAAMREHLEATDAIGGEISFDQSLAATVDYYRRQFDPANGGLVGAPKFPSGLPLRLLLRHHHRTGDRSSLQMVVETLEGMAAGGIHDQLGGGFHRYSTDARWLVPHFEKMLYDNALLALAYTEGFQVTGKGDFETTARRILDYLIREMSDPDGGFYSATDADSLGPHGEDEEGRFFTWTPEELEASLRQDDARVVARYFGVTRSGDLDGRSVLHRPSSAASIAEELALRPEAVVAAVDRARPLLYEARLRRPAPLLDDKIVAAWNGLTISALAIAGRTFDEAAYIDRAERAAEFSWRELRVDRRLRRSHRAGQAANPAVLEDYAFLVAAYLDLYEATFDPLWLRRARQLQRTLDEHYSAAEGGYHRTAAGEAELLARERPMTDGAIPSGNSVSALNLLRLDRFTTEDRYRAEADRLLATHATLLEKAPWAASELQLALDFRSARVREIVLVGEDLESVTPFLDRLRGRFSPHQVLIACTEESLDEVAEQVPFVAGKHSRGGAATAYVCERGVCQLPTTDVDVFVGLLEGVTETGAEKQSSFEDRS